jgi:hypothetical protein
MLRRRWALVGLMAGIVLIAVGAIVTASMKNRIFAASWTRLTPARSC